MFYENVDLTKIYDDDSAFPLGARHSDESNGKEYEFVKYSQGSGAVAGTQGSGVYYCVSGTTAVPGYTVTKDHDSTTSIITFYNMFAGQLQAALTDGKYGWIQKKGFSNYACPTNNSLGIGEQVSPADADGQVLGVAAGTAVTPYLGMAWATDGGSGNSVAAGGILWQIP
jgi:cytochrome c biogenesis protein ResB